jgi:hypothetical protein
MCFNLTTYTYHFPLRCLIYQVHLHLFVPDDRLTSSTTDLEICLFAISSPDSLQIIDDPRAYSNNVLTSM